MYYVYIVRCADGSFYVGSAQDLDARLKAHNDGRGTAYTFKHRPVRLVYFEMFGLEAEALTRERQLKRWSRREERSADQGRSRTLEASQQTALIDTFPG